MTDLYLAPIKERLAKAHTEWGEWTVQSDEWGECHSVIIQDDGPGYSPIAEGIGQGEDDGLADAEFIAHAPSDLAALVAEVERLRGQIDAVREHHVPVEANYYAATVTECCSCPGPWPCPTIRALEVGE